MNIQPNEILEQIGVKDLELGNKILSTAFSFLAYLKPGEVLETQNITFTKLSDDVFHIDITLDGEEVIDSLERAKVIRIPV